MAATIKDIARELNISISTVSYALNGGPRSVPEGTRALVMEKARALGYRPNRNARSLITGRSYSIGIVPSMLGPNLALGPYFQLALNGIINRAEEEDQDVLVFARHDVCDEGIVDDLLDGRVDGVIFLAPPSGAASIEIIKRGGLPHVVLGSSDYSACSYVVDNAQGVRLGMQHLYDLGHRRIAYMSGFKTMSDSHTRLAAYVDFMDSRGLEVPDSYIGQGDFTLGGSYPAARAILAQRPAPTAVYCANDEMAFAIQRAAHELGARVPEDLSVAGFDDNPFSSYVVPALTTVRQPISEMGSAALSAVVGAVRTQASVESRRFPAELIVRLSTSRPKEDANLS
jgi:DNA-binding LacI/PurR family transcriptional regulator